MQETLQQREAFEYYYSLDSARSYHSVAMKFEVSKSTIRNWGRKFNWQERIEQRDMEIAKKLEKKTNDTILNEKANYRKIIKATIKTFVDNLTNGKIDVNSIADVEKLVKLDLLLMGESTDKQDVNITDESPRERIASRIASIAKRIGEDEDS